MERIIVEVIVTSKFRVTIPKEAKEALGIKGR